MSRRTYRPIACESAEQLVFVKDGYAWLAALVPPLWLLWKRMWLEFAIYVGGTGLLVWLLTSAGATDVGNALLLIIQIVFGFEAGALYSASLERRGWRLVGTVSGRNAEDAERRFLEDVAADAHRDPPGRHRRRPVRAARDLGRGGTGAGKGRARARPPRVRQGHAVMQRVAIIDYGSGNLHSAAKAFERAARESEANAQITLTADPDIVAAADRIVLPGVGAFADCKRGLEAVPGMREALEDTVRVKGRPFLGICVGMQLMASRGLEFEIDRRPRLDRRRGARHRAQRPDPQDPAHGLEHAQGRHPASAAARHPDRPRRPARLLRALVPLRAGGRAHVVAETDYGGPVTAFIAKDNMAGTQFHPEKSQTLGLKLIANFLKWRP